MNRGEETRGGKSRTLPYQYIICHELSNKTKQKQKKQQGANANGVDEKYCFSPMKHIWKQNSILLEQIEE